MIRYQKNETNPPDKKNAAERLGGEAEGKAMEESTFEERTSEEKRPAALSLAYRILQSGANSRKMLRDKILKKGFSQSEAEDAIALCEKQGFLNEKRLFFAHCEYLAHKKHFGKRRIRLEMLKKFDRESVEEFFDEATEEIDFSHLATQEAAKCAHRGKRYAVSRLHTLGYTSHEIYEAVSSFEDDTPSDF